jgi:hypothetical protein
MDERRKLLKEAEELRRNNYFLRCVAISVTAAALMTMIFSR